MEITLVLWAAFAIAGHLYLYYAWADVVSISSTDRIYIYSVCLALTVLPALAIVFTLKDIKWKSIKKAKENQTKSIFWTQVDALKYTGKMAITRDMMLVCTVYTNTGFMYGFMRYVFPFMVSSTSAFGDKTDRYAGLISLVIMIPQLVIPVVTRLFPNHTKFLRYKYSLLQ